MISSIIGSNLKNLIKARDFTQEEFAEITGIGLSTLKKYISGKVFYPIDTLDLFAEQLQCSYDYLLGKSLTPERELQDVKEATRLQDGALERLLDYAKNYDFDEYSKKYIETLSTLIQSDFLLDKIIDYYFIDPEEDVLFEDIDSLPQPGILVGHEYLSVPDLEKVYLYTAIEGLIKSKADIGQNITMKRRNYKIKTKRKE